MLFGEKVPTSLAVIPKGAYMLRDNNGRSCCVFRAFDQVFMFDRICFSTDHLLCLLWQGLFCTSMPSLENAHGLKAGVLTDMGLLQEEQSNLASAAVPWLEVDNAWEVISLRAWCHWH